MNESVNGSLNKRKIIIVYNNLGVGGITKSLLTLLNLVDYSLYDITLYIRRDDVLDFYHEIPPQVHTVLIYSELKHRVFEKNIKGKIVSVLYRILLNRHKHLAKELFIRYKYPIQRKKEQKKIKGQNWDIAISFSTDGDDPVFVDKCVSAEKKYIFVRQSTTIASRNIKSMRNYNAIISINPLLVSWICDFTKHSTKVITICNYSDYERIRQLSKMKQIEKEKRFVISTCGRLCSTKGYDYVIEIANELMKRGLEFVWYWIGDGPAHKDMEKLINHYGLEKEIQILGNKTNPYPYISACDLYIQPSKAEAFGNTISEALILKKPVISTDTAGGKHILQNFNCGILVNNPTKEIPDIIMSFANRPEKLVEEQRKVELINWEEDKQRYLKQWNCLLNGTIEKE